MDILLFRFIKSYNRSLDSFFYSCWSPLCFFRLFTISTVSLYALLSHKVYIHVIRAHDKPINMQNGRSHLPETFYLRCFFSLFFRSFDWNRNCLSINLHVDSWRCNHDRRKKCVFFHVHDFINKVAFKADCNKSNTVSYTHSQFQSIAVYTTV